MDGIPAGLEEVIAEVRAGQEPVRTVRQLVSWFGGQRRGAWIVSWIDEVLNSAGLVTEPDFRTVWIDSEITFRRVPEPVLQPEQAAEPAANAAPLPRDPSGTDYLVRMLDSANRGVVSVNPDDAIEVAVTRMILHDFSQLAVMTNERELKGAISWKSIGMRLSQRSKLEKVRDALSPADAVDETASLFDVVRRVVEDDFVFVRKMDRKISGIVTASDLSRQFHSLSEPFLILSRIEAHLRQLIGDAFNVEEMRAVVDEADANRKATLTSVTQLTFGDYQRLLEREANWNKLGFVACRKTFCAALDEVRKRRNEIMHFHPDTIQGLEIQPLRQLLHLLEVLKVIKPENEGQAGAVAG